MAGNTPNNETPTFVPQPGDPHPLSPVPSSRSGMPSHPSRAGNAAPPQDLLHDKLLLAAPRIEFNARTVPALGGIPLLARIGQGGMGAVYLGVHPRLDQDVAVKVLPFTLMQQQPQLVDRFMREARIAARIKSPHLVSVLDVNEENGLFFLVMEFVAGSSAGSLLRAAVKAGQPGIAENIALEICIAASEGLAVAHDENIIHRDIKPDNILIPRSRHGEQLLYSQAKLSDLGLARDDEAGQSLTGTQAALGTPGYMAPEQAMDAKKCGKPADIFSMGATLHALLTGQSAFSGSSPMEIIFATIQKPALPVSQFRQDVSPQTQALIERCLEKSPEKRYADGTVLLHALKACRDAVGQQDRTQRGSVVPVQLPPSIPNAPLAPSSASAPSAPSSASAQSQEKPSTFLGAGAAATMLPPPLPDEKKRGVPWAPIGIAAAALIAIGLAIGTYYLIEPGKKEPAPIAKNDSPGPSERPQPPVRREGPVTPPPPPLGPFNPPPNTTDDQDIRVVVPPAREKDADLEREMELAEAYIEEQKYTEARVILERLSKRKNLDVDTLDQIEADLQEVRDGLSADRYTKLMLEGRVALKNQMYKEALEAFTAALREKPESEDARKQLAQTAQQMMELEKPPVRAERLPGTDRYTQAINSAREAANRAPPTRFGAQVSDLTDELKKRYDLAAATGAVVMSVVAGSPAEKAGLKQGHCITQIGFVPIAKAADFLQAVRAAPPGRTTVKIVSERETFEMNVAIGPRLRDEDVSRKWADAEAFYRRALAERPNDPAATQELVQVLNSAGREALDANRPMEAFNSYSKAAQYNDATAQYMLGWMCYRGTGVQADYRSAANWYAKSASQGNMWAQYDLGCLYMQGLGVQQNDQEAVRLFVLSASQNLPIAQNNLGVMYLNGRGVQANRNEAYRWIKKAAEQGEPLAKQNLKTYFGE